jgi:hypothetical protein
MLTGKIELHDEGYKTSKYDHSWMYLNDDLFDFNKLAEARAAAIKAGFTVGKKVVRVSNNITGEGRIKCLSFTKKEGWYCDEYTPLVVEWLNPNGKGYEMSYRVGELLLVHEGEAAC